MSHSTPAIILKQTNYGDSSLIVQAFTKKFGLQSYLVSGARKPKAKIRSSLLQPMHLVEIVASHRENQSLHRIAEVRAAPVFQSIPYDIRKSTVAIFLNEILYKCLRQQAADESLFDFVYHAISWLDMAEDMPPNFHLHFLMRLTRFLGFQPAPQRAGQAFFDLHEGVFKAHRPVQPLFLEEPHSTNLSVLLTIPLESMHTIRIPAPQRRELLKQIVLFYQLHIDGLGEIKSLPILEELLA